MKKNISKLVLDVSMISIIIPIFILGIWCFTKSWPYPGLLPQNYSSIGFEYIFNVSNLKVLIDSILISLIITFITIIISIPASKAIALYKFKGKKIFELLILSPIIIPMISVAMGIHITFIKLGLANSLLGVVIINIIPCSQYFLTMLIGGGRIVTYPMIMFPYIQSGDRNIAALYSMVFLIVSIMVLILIEKRIKIYYIGNEETSYLI